MEVLDEMTIENHNLKPAYALSSPNTEPVACQSSLSLFKVALTTVMIMFGSRSSPRLQPLGSSPKKRKFNEDVEESMKENRGLSPVPHICRRNFVKVPKADSIYQTEEWKSKQTTLYQPLTEDVMINLNRIEQISFASGSFFIADETGQYCGSKDGNVLHLWRYKESENKLFISRTFLFTNLQAYTFIRSQLDEM